MPGEVRGTLDGLKCLSQPVEVEPGNEAGTKALYKTLTLLGLGDDELGFRWTFLRGR